MAAVNLCSALAHSGKLINIVRASKTPSERDQLHVYVPHATLNTSHTYVSPALPPYHYLYHAQSLDMVQSVYLCYVMGMYPLA